MANVPVVYAPGAGPDTPPKKTHPLAITAEPDEVWTSLPLQTREQKRAFMKVINDPGLSKSDIFNVPLTLENIAIHTYTKVDGATGECVTLPRIILILAGGETVTFSSQGILRSLRLLAFVEGAPPWTPGLRIVIRQVEIGNARRTYKIDLVDEPAAPKAQKKG